MAFDYSTLTHGKHHESFKTKPVTELAAERAYAMDRVWHKQKRSCTASLHSSVMNTKPGPEAPLFLSAKDNLRLVLSVHATHTILDTK